MKHINQKVEEEKRDTVFLRERGRKMAAMCLKEEDRRAEKSLLGCKFYASL